MTWQPIDTAPTDGSPILVLAGAEFPRIHIARFEHRTVTINQAVVQDDTGWTEVTKAEVGFTLRNVTHWMPLPTLP